MEFSQDPSKQETIPQREWKMLRGATRLLSRDVEELLARDTNDSLRRALLSSVGLRYFGDKLKGRSNLARRLFDHDADGPLATINSLLHVYKKFPNQLETNVWRIKNTVEAILFWVENSELPIEDISLKSFMNEARVPLNTVFDPEKERIEFNVVDDGLAFMNSPTVNILLCNIVKNARMHGRATKVVIEVSRNSEMVKIEISDDGIGIKDDLGDNIFNLGFSGKGSTGLGLADAKKRMQAMGGDITYEANGGIKRPLKSGGFSKGGAKFILTLKAA